ncbi:uncharacterized protein LOC135137165 [Zophobas morio]|uniref:uncharacterized protein LOC135137165 n=1 Tax=Zophobas morio TaxID=2755281 RepID=UPI003083C5EC
MACLSRIINLNRLKLITPFARNLTSNSAPVVSSLPPVILTNKHLEQIPAVNNPWIWQINNKIESPIINKLQIDFPNGLKYIPPLQDPKENKELELPPTPNAEITKHAVRMIVIRRRKMKRHKLRKLRKRMKFEWAKRRQRREWNKEKAFQAKLIQQCKQGEAFVAEKYVEERLSKLAELTKAKNRKKGMTNREL